MGHYIYILTDSNQKKYMDEILSKSPLSALDLALLSTYLNNITKICFGSIVYFNYNAILDLLSVLKTNKTITSIKLYNMPTDYKTLAAICDTLGNNKSIKTFYFTTDQPFRPEYQRYFLANLFRNSILETIVIINKIGQEVYPINEILNYLINSNLTEFSHDGINYRFKDNELYSITLNCHYSSTAISIINTCPSVQKLSFGKMVRDEEDIRQIIGIIKANTCINYLEIDFATGQDIIFKPLILDALKFNTTIKTIKIGYLNDADIQSIYETNLTIIILSYDMLADNPVIKSFLKRNRKLFRI